MEQQTFIQILKEIPATHCFVYKNKKYPFQIDFFKYSSNFFLNNEQTINRNKVIPLVDEEYEESLNFSESSIISFIKYVQREKILLNDDNVFALNYLGIRYEINCLIESTRDYIEKHQNGLLLQILTSFQLDSKFDKDLYEDILSTNLINYISDDRLLSLEFPIIYRAIEKTQNKSDTKIIDFCFKCLDKFGRQASSLFGLIDLGDMLNEKINLLLTKYSKTFDFHFINSSLLQSIYERQNELFMKEKKQDDEQEKFSLLLNKIKEDQNKMMNEFSSEIQKIKEDNEKKQAENELLKEEINKLKNDNIIKEKLNEIQLEHQKEINQMKEEISFIKLQLEQKSKEIESFKQIKCDVNKLNEEKCYFWLHNYKDVKRFNHMNGEMQIYILLINQFVLFKNNQPIINKIIDFLLYLSNEVMKFKQKPNNNFNYIFIHCNKSETEKNIDFSSIGINSMLLKLLLENNTLSSSEFQNHISSFNAFYFEISYPSELFDSIYNKIFSMKKSNVKISIFIHSLKETDFKFAYNKDVDKIQFDTTVNVIKGINSYGPSGSFFHCESITEITIPSSVISIGNSAFSYCRSLTQVLFVLPSTLISIGKYAFHCCSSLTQISIPSSVTEIGECAFASCESLAKISILSSEISIGNSAFVGCSSLTQISIPSSATSIKGSTFARCYKLNKIDILPCNEKRIECLDNKFLVFKTNPTNDIFDTLIWGNPNISSATFPSFVKIIGDHAYYQISKLTQISIPSSVTSINDNAFISCQSLTKISIPSSIVSIGNSSFSFCRKITQITFENPSSLTSIGECAFYECESLTQISIPSSVISIGKDAFGRCSKLKQISIPSSVTEIGGNILKYVEINKVEILPCNEKRIEYFENKLLIYKTNIENETYESIIFANLNVNTVTIPSFIKIIGDSAFYDCNQLTQISIPSSVTSIGEYAFHYCQSLKQVSFAVPSSLTKIGNDSFYGCKSLTQISLPSSLKIIGNNSFHSCESLTQISIPSSVTEIGNHAFYGCKSVTKLSIPSSVISIGDYAFYNCNSLTQISIPSSVTSFGGNAFPCTTELNKIEILPCNEKRIEYFEDKLLIFKANAENDTYDTIIFANLDVSTVTIPSFIKIIGNYAFYECKQLTKISIPSSVTSIGESAFSSCSSLTQIIFETPSSVVSIEKNAFGNCHKLEQISIPSSIKYIGENAFEHCENLTQISLPSFINHNNLSITLKAKITII